MKEAFKIIKAKSFPLILLTLVSLPSLIMSFEILFKGVVVSEQLKNFFFIVSAITIIYFFWKQILGLLKKIWEIKIVKYTVITVIIIALLNRTEQGKELLAKLVTWGAILGIIWLFLGKTLKKWFS